MHPMVRKPRPSGRHAPSRPAPELRRDRTAMAALIKLFRDLEEREDERQALSDRYCLDGGPGLAGSSSR